MLSDEFLRGITDFDDKCVLQRISHIYSENNKKLLPNLTYEPNETFMLLHYNNIRYYTTIENVLLLHTTQLVLMIVVVFLGGLKCRGVKARSNN